MQRKTAYVILGLLCEGPLTGYQIKRIVDIRFRFFWRESYGQIFPVLKQLCDVAYVDILPSASTNKRAQKAYAITPAGRDALTAWLKMPVETETVRLEILLKMYFSNLVDAETMVGHLETFKTNHIKDLEMLNLFEKELIGMMSVDENHPMVLSVVKFGQKINRAYLEWAEEAENLMRGEANDETEH